MAVEFVKEEADDYQSDIAEATLEQNIRRLIHADAEIKRLAAETEAMKAKRELVEKKLLDQFVDAGIQNMNVLGRTVYLYRSLKCSIPAETMEEVVEVLDENGVGSLAPRTPTAARIKALIAEDEGWVEKFGSMIHLYEEFSIRSRNA